MESPLVKFLIRRQRFCKSALDVVCVDSIGGGAVIECFGNAYSQLRRLQSHGSIRKRSVNSPSIGGTLMINVANTSTQRLQSKRGLSIFWTVTLPCSPSTTMRAFRAVFRVLLFTRAAGFIRWSTHPRATTCTLPQTCQRSDFLLPSCGQNLSWRYRNRRPRSI